MNDWKTELNDTITDIAELCLRLGLPPTLANEGRAAAADYPLFVPKSFLDRIEKGNPSDPVLLQILPQRAETLAADGFSTDPLDETASGQLGCILQKYAGRCLVLTTNRCGVHCRFCFRRHQRRVPPPPRFFEQSFDNVSEIILSGGDPLTLDDTELHSLVHYIRKFPNVKRLRIHSRLPVILPKRITPEFRQLADLLPTFLVLHINHPNELSGEFFERIQTLNSIVLMSQTVLLKGVNDDTDTLVALFEMLANHKIIPYYLHQLDRVSGAAHFEVSIEEGKRLMREVQHRLSGYAVPQYVQEIPNEPSKRRLYEPVALTTVSDSSVSETGLSFGSTSSSILETRS
jgi:EF-P beta-lysylation protein EpmB